MAIPLVNQLLSTRRCHPMEIQLGLPT